MAPLSSREGGAAPSSCVLAGDTSSPTSGSARL